MIASLFSHCSYQDESETSINNQGNIGIGRELQRGNQSQKDDLSHNQVSLSQYMEQVKACYPRGTHNNLNSTAHALLMLLPSKTWHKNRKIQGPTSPHIDMIFQMATQYEGNTFFFFLSEVKNELYQSLLNIDKMFEESPNSRALKRIQLIPIRKMVELRQHLLSLMEDLTLLPPNSLIIIDRLSSFNQDVDESERRPDSFCLGLLEILPCDYVVVDSTDMDIAFYNRFFSGVVCTFEEKGNNFVLEVIRNNFYSDPWHAKFLLGVEKKSIIIRDIQMYLPSIYNGTSNEDTERY